jgi:probable rRNA maturation factor
MRIEVSHDHPHLRFSRTETIRAIKSVLRKEKMRMEGVSVVFTNNSRIRAINGKHLNHNYVTDVIAFELEQSPGLETEIYINLDRAKSQARTYGETYQRETMRLLIHGLLHVLGYSDKSEKETARMRREEDAVLNSLKVRKN